VKEKGIVMKKAEPIPYEEFKQKIIPVIGEFLDYMIKEFGMDEFDLVCNFNWGYFDGKPVVIDYGHNYFGENLEEVSL